MRAWCLAVALLLPACASTPSRAPDATLFEDARFAAQAETIDAGAVLAPSARMREFVATELAAGHGAKGRQQALFDALYKEGEPWLAYDGTITYTASEAFAARSGNCLSLVLMTAALARELGLEVRYQSIDTWKSWSRDDSLKYLNSHVNIVLLVPRGPGIDEMVIDFMPIRSGQLRRSRVLPEATIVAMYMNNRAVELLAEGKPDRAYWWARSAIRQDAHYLDAVNTLAVIYHARGLLADSERALRWVLAQEPDNIVALDNLAIALRAQGRMDEAEAVAKRMAELQPIAPFHYYDLGEAALRQGRYLDAKELFLKEMRRDARYDKFHASLALAHYALGELAKAQAQMAIALDNSTTAADRETYGRMLKRLRLGEHP
jgi:Tfp pilus assembly protein PilF